MEDIEKRMSSSEKALSVNLKSRFYGCLAEIGAGQEVARWFFRAGKASNTIAKTMSAYDMVFSDSIYGAEKGHRYVCESRVKKMLNHEYSLLIERLWNTRSEASRFFVFADTVSSKRADGILGGHGWLGVRFQSEPLSEPSDVIIHVRLLDRSVLEQQEAIGLIGVNLIHGCAFDWKNPEAILERLMDNLKGHDLEVDMIQFSGPAFTGVDNRLMSLKLVQMGFTNSALFAPSGENLHPSEVLYQKHLLVQRGRFHPITHLHLDMMESAKRQFLKDPSIKEEDVLPFMEITINNLLQGGSIDISDFLSRVNLLAQQGYYVMVSNYPEYFRLVEFFSKYTVGKIGIIMGVGHLNKVFDSTFYSSVEGGVMSALGLLFRKGVYTLIYPAHSMSTTAPSSGANDVIYTSKNFLPAKPMEYLYRYLTESGAIEDINDFNPEHLSIDSQATLNGIKNGDSSWQRNVPKEIADKIKNGKLFEYGSKKGQAA